MASSDAAPFFLRGILCAVDALRHQPANAGISPVGWNHPRGVIHHMRKFTIFAATAATALMLSACSEKTQDAAGTAAESAGNDVANAADKAAAATDELGAKAAAAVDDAAAKTDEMGDKAAAEAKKAAASAKQETAEVEASLHNESVSEAKAD